jgi:hypothetical protein
MPVPLPTCSFNWSPTTTGLATPVPTSVGGVLRVSVECGRPNEFSNVEPGTMTLTVDNRDRALDPTWTGGPFGANVTLDKWVQFKATYAGIDYYLHTGWTDSIVPQWPTPAESNVEITTLDALGLLLNTRIVGTAYYDAVIASGPDHYWRLGEPVATSTATVNDEIDPLGFGIFAFNVTAGIPGALPAETDTAIDTGNREGWVSLPTAVAYSGSGDFTIEAWILPRALGVFYLQDDGTGPFISADLGFGNLHLGVGDGTNYGHRTSSVQPDPYQWSHVALVKIGGDPNNWNIYLNGVNINAGTSGSGIVGSLAASTAGPLIGASYVGATAQGTWDGGLDELATYNRALSAAEVAAHYAAAGNFRLHRASGDRIADTLDAIDWPVGLRSIDGGGFNVWPAPSPLWKQPVLAYLQTVAASDGYPAVLFADGDGTIVYQDRNHAVPASKGTFGDGHLPYELPLLPAMASTDYKNEWVVTSENLATQTAAASIPAGTPIRAGTISGLQTDSAANVATIASDALSRSQTPKTRIRELRIHPLDDPTNLFPLVLGLKLMDRLIVGRTAIPGGGTPMSEDVRVQHIRHEVDFQTGDWWTTLQLAPT